MGSELRVLMDVREHDRSRAVRNEPLYAGRELIPQLVIDPAACGLQAASTRDVPGQLEHGLVLRAKHRDVDDVLGTRHDQACHLIEPPAHPRPVPAIVEAHACRVPR